MKVAHKKVNETLYIGLSGELDDNSAQCVRNELEAIINTDNQKKMVIDLSGVSFMDSTGIGVLIGRYKSAKKTGLQIFLANPLPSIDKILTLSGIYSIMPKIAF